MKNGKKFWQRKRNSKIKFRENRKKKYYVPFKTASEKQWKNIDTFLVFWKKQWGIIDGDGNSLENFEENNEVVSDDLPNSGTQQSVEEQGYSYESNEPWADETFDIRFDFQKRNGKY